jgi:hypothetical protein
MKKFYLTFALLTGALAVFSQHSINVIHNTNVTMQPKTYNQDRAVGYYFVDYEGYDASLGTPESGALFTNRRNPVYFNPGSPTQLGIGEAAVVFDTMIVTEDYVAFTPYPGNAVQSFDVDTIFARVYHENNSGMADTVIIAIKNVGPGGIPGTTTLWGDTIITTTSLTTPNTGNTYGFATFGFPVTMAPIAGGKFTFVIDYYGASVDTFGLISSNITTGVACANAAAGNEAIPSEVFPSAFYRYWTNTTLNATTPNSVGSGGLFIDCNNNAAADWSTEQAVQTWSIWASGTLTDNLGVDEEAAGVKVNAYPNPAVDFTTIEYVLVNNANVSVSITDLSGKVVYNNNLGKRDAGKSNLIVSTSEFSNGVYMYTITVDNKKVTRRIIVSK